MVTKIKSFKEALKKINIDMYSPELIRDLLFQLFIFEKSFDLKNSSNEVIICSQSDKLPDNCYIPEITEKIGTDYMKYVFITSDTGEGKVIYVNTINQGSKKYD